MSKGLDSYLSDIKAAEEMLRVAKEDYKKATIEKFEAGLLTEQVEASWLYMPTKGSGTLQPFCSRCRAVQSNGIKYKYCPNCGAKMRSHNYVPYILEEKPTAVTSPLSMLRVLYDSGMSYAEIAKEIGSSGQQVKSYLNGNTKPRKATEEKIVRLYDRKAKQS